MQRMQHLDRLISAGSSVVKKLCLTSLLHRSDDFRVGVTYGPG
jgi:hypothetical protein